jgi:hypothetical protein
MVRFEGLKKLSPTVTMWVVWAVAAAEKKSRARHKPARGKPKGDFIVNS